MSHAVIKITALSTPRNLFEVGRGGVKQITQHEDGGWLVDAGRDVYIVTGEAEARGIVQLGSPVQRVQERVAKSEAAPGTRPSQEKKALQTSPRPAKKAPKVKLKGKK